MKLNKIITSVLCVAVMGTSAAAFAGCGGGSGEVKELTITGSTSVQPLMIKLAAEYEKTHENVEINVGIGGSGKGVTDAQNGLNDFGMASRILKSEETGVVAQKIADDGIALIVNKNCTVTNVTTAEVKALYENGTPIGDIRAALSRSEGSGTRDAFHELLKIETLHTGTAGFEEIEQTSAVITNITGNSAGNTVGYISMGSLSSAVKALSLDGVAATTENVKNGSYTLSRPFNIVYKSWNDLNQTAKDFISWIISPDGQAIVATEGYIAL